MKRHFFFGLLFLFPNAPAMCPARWPGSQVLAVGQTVRLKGSRIRGTVVNLETLETQGMVKIEITEPNGFSYIVLRPRHEITSIQERPQPPRVSSPPKRSLRKKPGRTSFRIPKYIVRLRKAYQYFGVDGIFDADMYRLVVDTTRHMSGDDIRRAVLAGSLVDANEEMARKLQRNFHGRESGSKKFFQFGDITSALNDHYPHGYPSYALPPFMLRLAEMFPSIKEYDFTVTTEEYQRMIQSSFLEEAHEDLLMAHRLKIIEWDTPRGELPLQGEHRFNEEKLRHIWELWKKRELGSGVE